MRDAIRLWRRIDDVTAETYASRRERIGACLETLIETPWDCPQARRLIQRVRRHQHDLLTFLDHPEVPFENNLAERAISPQRK